MIWFGYLNYCFRKKYYTTRFAFNSFKKWNVKLKICCYTRLTLGYAFKNICLGNLHRRYPKYYTRCAWKDFCQMRYKRSSKHLHLAKEIKIRFKINLLKLEFNHHNFVHIFWVRKVVQYCLKFKSVHVSCGPKSYLPGWQYFAVSMILAECHTLYRWKTLAGSRFESWQWNKKWTK